MPQAMYYTFLNSKCFEEIFTIPYYIIENKFAPYYIGQSAISIHVHIQDCFHTKSLLREVRTVKPMQLCCNHHSYYTQVIVIPYGPAVLIAMHPRNTKITNPQ